MSISPARPATTAAPASPDALLRRLELRVLRRLDGRLQGDYRTLLRGSGVDFADLREYEPGDDVRFIDWNVTARTDTPHVRTYHEDRELTAWLLLDRSASMGFGPMERPKEVVLTELAAALARLLSRGGNLVGAIFYTGASAGDAGDAAGAAAARAGRAKRFGGPFARRTSASTTRATAATATGPTASARPSGAAIGPAIRDPNRPLPPRTLPPRSGRNHVLRLTQALLRPVPATHAATNLGDLFTAAERTIRRRSLVIVVSDFISEPGWERPLSMLSRRHDVVAIRLFDPREQELPDAGLIVVEDAETGELLSVDTSDPAFRSRFREAADRQETEIAAAARRAHVDLHAVSTDDDLVTALIRIVERRRRRRR